MDTPKLDLAKLSPEQRDKLDAYNDTQKQLTALSEIADMVHEVVNQLDSIKKTDSTEKVGALLIDMRESLSSLASKEDPETPDIAKPIVETLLKVEKALSASIKTIDVKPVVEAPQVNIGSPSVNVDLKGVEKAVNEIPKAFKTALTSLKIPKPDYTPLLSKWDEISEQLVSIEIATRMKPQPGSIKVSNLSEVYGGVTINNAAGTSAVRIQDGGNSITVDGTVSTTHTDTLPVTQNITVVDSASATATGANNQTIVIGNPTASSTASFVLSSHATVRVEVTGIWTGTLTSEHSIDGGVTWVALGVHQAAYTTSTFTAGFVGGASVSGATHYRMRATATMTGTAVVRVTESVNPQSVYIANAAPSGNVISSNNSSIVTLGGGAVFTGVSEDVSNFAEMRITVTASHASATDGLSIQQSTDNVNWDITDTYTIPAATGKTFVVPRQAKWFRIVYTNGGTNQSYFRLSSLLNRMGTEPSSQRASDGYSNENDLQEVWAFGSHFNGTTWDRTPGSTLGAYSINRPVAVSALSTSPFGTFATSAAVSVKASAGAIYSVHASNSNAAIRYLQVFNKASAPALNDVPAHSFPIPAGGSILIGTDFFGPNGGYGSSGIAVGVSSTNATFTVATAADHNLNGMFL